MTGSGPPSTDEVKVCHQLAGMRSSPADLVEVHRQKAVSGRRQLTGFSSPSIGASEVCRLRTDFSLPLVKELGLLLIRGLRHSLKMRV